VGRRNRTVLAIESSKSKGFLARNRCDGRFPIPIHHNAVPMLYALCQFCCTSSPLLHNHGLFPGPPGPICPGISCAPSALSFSSVWFFWYSITLRFLKYVTYSQPISICSKSSALSQTASAGMPSLPKTRSICKNSDSPNLKHNSPQTPSPHSHTPSPPCPSHQCCL
jgi:hypothetical protein